MVPKKKQPSILARPRFRIEFHPDEALLAEDVTRRAARDGELGGDLATAWALKFLLKFLQNSRKFRSIVRSNSGSFVGEVVHLERLERNCSQYIRTKQITYFYIFKNQIAFTYL